MKRVLLAVMAVSSLLAGCNLIMNRELHIEPGFIAGVVDSTDAGVFINSPSILRDSNEFVWGGSCVQAEDGRYHLFYSMFEAGPGKPSFTDSWLLSSKIAHAVSDYPDRDFRFTNIVLNGAAHDGDSSAWDAQGVHNPHIKKFGSRYYLYYIGSRDPGEEPEGSPGYGVSKRDRIQQSQQIAVINVDKISDLVNGNFIRPEKPLLSPRTRVKPDHVLNPSPPGTVAKPDNLVMVNPSVTYRPSDRKYLLYFKGNLWDPHWRGVHGVAISDHPDGPFEADDRFMFDIRMPDGKLASAEDPFVWFHAPSKRFYAIFKDFTGRFTGTGPGLALLTSLDGFDWQRSINPLFSKKEIRMENGTIVPLSNLERPQVLLDDNGDPLVFYGAISISPVGGKTDGSTFNLQVRIQEKTLR